MPPIPVKDLSVAQNMEIVQLMAFGSEQLRSDISLFPQILTDCEPTGWNPFFCDIMPKDSDKSAGIDAMIAYFGINLSETIAFGDADNDLGMLTCCGTSIAMGNATPSLKVVADYVTTDITDHGIKNAFIYNELKIRGFQVDVGVVEHRTIDKDGKRIRKQYEVDFVANQGSQRYYIQSAFIMPTDAKERQESASLLNIDDSFKKIIIVKDYIKPKRNEEGIVTIGLIDFLLNPGLLNW